MAFLRPPRYVSGLRPSALVPTLAALIAVAFGAPSAAVADDLVDTTPPAAPTITSFGTGDYSGYGTEANPSVHGTAEPGSRVEVIPGGWCEGSGMPVLATGTADELSGPGIPVAAPADQRFSVSIRAIDNAGNVSDCSAASSGYIYDVSVPGPPTLTFVWPDSPGEATTPAVYYEAAEGNPGSLLWFFDHARCEGEPFDKALIVKGRYGSTTVSVMPFTTTPFYVIEVDHVGHRSACPAAPQLVYTQLRFPWDRSADPTPAPTPPPPAAPAAMTLFARAPTCIGAASAKARRPIQLSYAAPSPATLSYRLEVASTKKPPRRCTTPAAAPKKAAFKLVSSGPVTTTSSPGDARVGKATIEPRKPLRPGLYRLTTTATAADGRSASTTDLIQVLRAKA